MSLNLRIDGLRIDNSGNIINSFDCKAIGRDSYIGFRSNNSLINGHNNLIQDDCSNCYISGSNNTIESGAANSSIIGGDGFTITEPNTVISGGVTFVDGVKKENIVTVVDASYQITGSEDVLLIAPAKIKDFVSVIFAGLFTRYNFTSEHDFQVGDVVNVTNSTVPAYNGLQTVTGIQNNPNFYIITDRTYTETATGTITRDEDVVITMQDSPIAGKRIDIIRLSDSNLLTIDGNGFNINGNPTFDLLLQYDAVDLLFTGNEYIIN